MYRTHVPIASIVGKPYGSVFELRKKELVWVENPTSTADLIGSLTGLAHDEGHSEYRKRAAAGGVDKNEAAQTWDHDALMAFKKSGASSEAVIAKLVASSTTFAHKSKTSQAKYIQRKAKVHMLRVRVQQPTPRLLLHASYSKGGQKTWCVGRSVRRRGLPR